MTDLTDDSEEFIFRIKTKFFQDIPHPKIILKYIEQLNQKCHIETAYIASVIDFGAADLVYILKNYTAEILQLKSDLAKESDICNIKTILEKIYAIHWSVLLRLVRYLPQLEFYPDQHLRQSQPFDAYAIYRFVEKSGLNEDEIKTYICKEIQMEKPENFSLLTNGCLTSRKIISNV